LHIDDSQRKGGCPRWTERRGNPHSANGGWTGSPSVGNLRVLGESPTSGSGDLKERVGYLDQERPLYKSFRVAEMLRFGAKNNPNWNMAVAQEHLAQLDIPLRSRIGNLSEASKRRWHSRCVWRKNLSCCCWTNRPPRLTQWRVMNCSESSCDRSLIVDSSVLLSTHSLGDVVAICDYVVVLAHSRVVLSNDTEYVLESHRILSAVHDGDLLPPPGVSVINSQSILGTVILVRVELPIDETQWRVERPTSRRSSWRIARRFAGRERPP